MNPDTPYSPSIFEARLLEAHTAPPKPTAASVRAEAIAKVEAARIAEALDEYGDIDPADPGDMIAFSRTVPSRLEPDETTTLHYVFVRSEAGLYYGTGTTPQGVTWDLLVNYLVDLGVRLEDVVGISPVDMDDLSDWI